MKARYRGYNTALSFQRNSFRLKQVRYTGCVTAVIDNKCLLVWERFGECLEHLVFVLDAQLSAALLVNALLPQHVLRVEN